MKWHVSVFDKKTGKLLFAAPCEDWIEAKALATEARSQRPSAKIFVRDQTNTVQEWV